MSFGKTAGYITLIIFIVLGVFLPSLLSHSPFSASFPSYLPPSKDHWLGTNHLGQDVFTQLIYGARTSLIIGFSVALLSTFLSASLGLISGFSKRLGSVINGAANVFLVIPSLLLILIVVSFVGGSLVHLVLVLALVTWAPYMRLIRSAVLSLREREFVKAASLYGGGTFYILRKHLLSHIAPLVKTKFILSFRSAILMEAGLSFLGLGDPNVISWGRILQDSFNQNAILMGNAWTWLMLPPVLMLMMITVAIALVGEREERQSKKPWRGHGSPRDSLIKTSEFSLNPVIPKDDCVLQCEQLGVQIDGQTLLRDIHFDVQTGQIVSIVGTSGAGKTTLGKAIYGLFSPEQISGTVFVKQKNVYDNSRASGLDYWHDISFVFQDPRAAMNPVMSIKDQFLEVLPSKQSKQEKNDTLTQSLEDVHLDTAVLHRYPHELSGGTLSRIALALALIHRPPLVIADESTSGLDPILKRNIVELLQRKIKQTESSLLFITHDLEVAGYLSDKMVVLKNGKQLASYDMGTKISGK